mgnify:CR=1 FL=1
MNEAGGVNCRPGSVERKRARLFRSEIAPNWPAWKFCDPALLVAMISPSVTLTYTLEARVSGGSVLGSPTFAVLDAWPGP